MHVLVTGAAGFFGGHLVSALRHEGHTVRALLHSERPWTHLELEGVEFARGDLLDERAMKDACRGVGGVIHAAGRMGMWSRGDAEQRRVNVEGTSCLLRAAHKQGVERIVHVSSVAAVGATREGRVLDEEAPWSAEFGRVHYALSKRQAEERALAAARRGSPLCVVNPGSLHGPHLGRPGPTGLVAAHLAGALRWTPPGGTSIADVEDVARSTVSALERGRSGERYILGGHNETFEALYEELHALFGGRRPRRVASQGVLRLAGRASTVLDAMRLSRPAWAPELLLASSYRAWFSSAKAEQELDHRIRPLEEILRRSAGEGLLAASELPRPRRSSSTDPGRVERPGREVAPG